MFIPVFAKGSQWLLRWARWIKTTSFTDPINFMKHFHNKIHLLLGLSLRFFDYRFVSIYHLCPTACTTNCVYFYWPTIFDKESEMWISSLCTFLHTPVTFRVLARNVFLNTFSETASMYVSPLAWETNFQMHRSSEAVVLCNSIFTY